VTRERWAQIGITAQFLIVVRTLGEFFRLRHVHGTSLSATVAAPYIGGALIAAGFCWAGVTLYFFRRYTLSVWVTLVRRLRPVQFRGIALSGLVAHTQVIAFHLVIRRRRLDKSANEHMMLPLS
jgi:hypothetical protein